MNATQKPQGGFLRKGAYLTDGGLETTLIFHYGIELAHFAAFELLRSAEGRNSLTRYYMPYLSLARKHQLNFILETPTWRASKDWGYLLGYSDEELAQVNRDAVGFIRNLQRSLSGEDLHVVLSGNVGPRGDGYIADQSMDPGEAMAYHLSQILAFAEAKADVITALTMTNSDEAAGIVAAARAVDMPVVISFTVETDGRLPSGELLQAAIEKTDEWTDGYAAYFMLNCAHPEHFKHVFAGSGAWKQRLQGLRANASTLSHEELDASETLDTGDKQLLTAGYSEMDSLLPNLNIFGGCCGTDHSHMEMICDRVVRNARELTL